MTSIEAVVDGLDFFKSGTGLKKIEDPRFASPDSNRGANRDNYSKRDPEEILMNSQAQEGQSLTVPYVGSVTEVIKRIKDHLRSAVSYAGEKDLYSAHKKVSASPADYLIKLTESSRKESFER